MNWDYTTFIPMLYEATRITKGPVVELGVGLCSTPMLHALVTYGTNPRKLYSVDDNEGWISTMRSHCTNESHEFIHVVDWIKNLKLLAESKPSVVFIDCGKISDIPKAKKIRLDMIDLFFDAEILIVHDASNVLEYNSNTEVKHHFRLYDDHTQPTTLWLSNTRRPEYLFQRY